ncbi:histidine kinase [Branchiibius sp. NY16-3462-2]|uniref:sensor histidine kinase n=1 Tax=Branchiibius sp. NY16-3462-2 TaxID=1807500 RepID=UPI00079B9B2A|nr:histidine kinase [Branchiibius sp. NY16-3462-2]KYH46114.1 histidine kinase [Branchiibius sp. NY16-3462-2]
MSAPQPRDLESLTGVRSGKRSYYRELQRSDERLARAVTAMDSISRALVRTVEGPRGLLEEVVRAAREHWSAEWAVLALADGALPGSRPRLIVHDAAGRTVSTALDLPDPIREEVQRLAAGDQAAGPQRVGTARWVRVAMTLEGTPIGGLSVYHRHAGGDVGEDLAVLRILASQAAVSLHTSEQYQAGLALHRRAQQLNDQTAIQARFLAERTAALHVAERQLVVAGQRQLVDEERHRIARELHDTVSQQVLSVGMAVELARRDAQELGESASPIQDQLAVARDLSASAVEQLRQAIYALHQPHSDTVRTLPELLDALLDQHTGSFETALRVEGDAVELAEDVHHELTRAVGEALFNAAVHAAATRVVVRVRYRPKLLIVTIADNGTGDPLALRQHLRVSARSAGDGRHRGLANMQERMTRLGGAIGFRRARIGGVRVELKLPLPVRGKSETGLVGQLLRNPAQPAPAAERTA